MIKMEALARQSHGGRVVLSGEEFTVASDAEAADLEALRLAKRKHQTPVLLQSNGPHEIREVRAADIFEDATASDAHDVVETKPSSRGRYNRRDMRARR